MKITRHKIETGQAEFREVNKTSGKCAPGLPDTIVIHYTAGPDAESAIHTFMDPDVEASAHILIDEDGHIIQLIPFNKVAWHAGKSSWLDRNGLNSYSIGIEIVNAGRLEKSGNTWRSWFGKTYPDEQVVEAIHRNESVPCGWHRFTEEQITTTFQVCKHLMKNYNIRYILGHEEISPGRKCDPGPAFPLDKLRERLLYSNRKDEKEPEPDFNKKTGIVISSALNIRSGPSANHETIAKPLSHNSQVTILSEMNGWYHVETKLHGWVAKKYIQSKT